MKRELSEQTGEKLCSLSVKPVTESKPIEFQSVYFDHPAITGRCVDFFRAETAERNLAFFFIHGGGWKTGSRAHFHPIGLAYRELGFDFASTDYRLGGVTVFDQVADIREGMRLFAKHQSKNGRPTNLVLVGSSAGAHLAMLAALMPDTDNTPYRISGACVQAAPFTFEPWPDIFPHIWADMQAVAGAKYETNPAQYVKASPLTYVHKGMPPVFALHAENEHMFPLSLTEEFIRAAEKCGARAECKVYPNVEHGFFYSLERRQQKEAFEDILRFVASLKV